MTTPLIRLRAGLHLAHIYWQRLLAARERTVEDLASTAFFIDTGRCYHFTNCCLQRRVVTYSSGLKFMPRSRMWPKLSDIDTLDPLERAVTSMEFGLPCVS